MLRRSSLLQVQRSLITRISYSTSPPNHQDMLMEKDQCILVDEFDHPLGSASKRHCHTVKEGHPPPLHRAFSIFLFHPSTGKLLLQQRAKGKPTFPGLWSNTCCSHPLRGETLIQAMNRKLQDELGIPMVDEDEFLFLGRMHYHAFSDDPAWGEHELDHLYAVIKDVPITPNPQEVDSTQWLGITDLEAATRDAPEEYSPWFKAITRDWLLPPRNLWMELLSKRTAIKPVSDIIRYSQALK